jgi:diguanylate cyclase (GGDEF)-like protein
MSLAFMIVAASNLVVGYLLATTLGKSSQDAAPNIRFDRRRPSEPAPEVSLPPESPAPPAPETMASARDEEVGALQTNATADAFSANSSLTFHGAVEKHQPEEASPVDAITKATELLDAVAELVREENQVTLPSKTAEASENVMASLVDVSQLESTIESWWANDPHRSRPICVAQVEIDNFRQVTSELGTAAATQLASQIESRLLGTLRRDDLVALLGGSRFLVLFPNTESAPAAEMLNTVRGQLNATEFVFNNQVIHTTLTAGVTTARANESIEDFMLRAAAALNDARRGGRNQVAHHDGQRIATLSNDAPATLEREQVAL